MHRPGDAELFEDFCKDKFADGTIYVLPQHQPINPEDEDDVVPSQHAAFGIRRATQPATQPAWKDLGLAAVMYKDPSKKNIGKSTSSVRTLPR